MQIIDGKVVLDEEDREFLTHMLTLNMISNVSSISLRTVAQLWYDRGLEDATHY